MRHLYVTYGRRLSRAVLIPLVLAAASASSPTAAQERAPTQGDAARAAPDERYVVENYYKVKWGSQREFIDLYRKNHYPILKRQMEKGSIVEIVGVAPRFHTREESRWDYRVTIVYKNLITAHEPGSLSDDEMKKLFPDKVAFDRDERRRFELLEGHWDLPLVGVRLTR